MIVVVSLVACTSEQGTVPVVKASGEPTVDTSAVMGHAGALQESVPERAAGSQEEQAASTYLLGHLQTAGYIVRLDPVPVENLVDSTNVMTRFDEGIDFLVVTPYDTTPARRSPNMAVGLLLELARAANVAGLDRVGFVGLGAEFYRAGDTGEGERLGSRRLAQVLLDEEHSPSVIYLNEIWTRGSLGATGDLGDEMTSLARSRDIRIASSVPSPPAPEVFERAGFPSTVVSGGVEEVADVLLGILSGSR